MTIQNERPDERKRKRKRRIIITATASSIIVLLSLCYLTRCFPGARHAETFPPLSKSTPLPTIEYRTLTPLPTLTPTPTVTPQPTATPTPTPHVIIDGDGVNVRAGPSTDYAVIGVMNTGDTAPITGYYGQWWRIDYEGSVGWVATWVVSGQDTNGVPLVGLDAPGESLP
ncbi:MAG: SH3 domain-containing protein [Promethearchaeota archaeon]